MKMSEIDIVFIPIQTLPGSIVPEELIEHLSTIQSQGKIVVTAAGNFGPIANTLSSLAELNSVIGVAASDAEGKTLAEFSSRGVPGNLLKRPTITAPGINRISDSHSGITEIIKEGKRNVKYLTKSDVYKQWGRVISSKELENIHKNCYLISGTSIAAEHVSQIIALLIEFRRAFNLPCDHEIISMIIEDMARPMSGYENFEVGFGFIDIFTFKKYIKHICRSGNIDKALWNKKIKYFMPTGKGVGLLRLDNTKYYDIDFTT